MFYCANEGVFVSTGGGHHECLKVRGIEHIIEIEGNLSRIVTEFGETTEWKEVGTYLDYVKSGVWKEIPYPEHFAEPD